MASPHRDCTNIRKRIVLSLSLGLLAAALSLVLGQTLWRPRLLPVTGPYLGQKPPGTEGEPFARGIVPQDLHSATVFAPDGRQVYWKEMETGKNRIVSSELTGDGWTVPRPVSLGWFLLDTDDPCLSADGQKLFFTSWRPLKWYRPLPHKERIWYVEERKHGWSRPRPVDGAVNAMPIHWQMSVTEDGTLYFGSEGDIYRSPSVDERHAAPKRLPAPVNSDLRENTPFVAPDERYLIFASSRQHASQGMDDLYISFHLAGDAWSDAINLGPAVNSSAHELYPYVSPDSKYLFYLSGKSGTYDVYWLDAQIIKQLKPQID